MERGGEPEAGAQPDPTRPALRWAHSAPCRPPPPLPRLRPLDHGHFAAWTASVADGDGNSRWAPVRDSGLL